MDNIKVGDYLLSNLDSEDKLTRVKVERLTKTLAICTDGTRIRLKEKTSGNGDWGKVRWTIQTPELLNKLECRNLRCKLYSDFIRKNYDLNKDQIIRISSILNEK